MNIVLSGGSYFLSIFWNPHLLHNPQICTTHFSRGHILMWPL